jgi:hypothetical protein
MRVAGFGRGVALLLVSSLVVLPLTAKAGLPRPAFSVPAEQNLAEGMKTLEQCALKRKLIVMPPLPFQLTGDESSSSPLAEQTRAVMALSGNADVLLHVIVESSTVTGKEPEKLITDRVTAFVNQLPLGAPAVRGLLVEIKEPLSAPDLFVFGLVRLAVTAKASRPDLRLAFVLPPGFTKGHGDIAKRLATYSDLLGLTYSQGWREEAAWIAQEALNKPLILRLDAGMSARTTTYLTAALAASGSSVEILWSEPASAEAVAGLCAMNSFMARFITDDMLPTDSAAAPFSVTINGAQHDENRWFRGGQSSDLAMVAQVKGTPDQPVKVALQGVAPGPVDVQWYDPATGARLPAGEVTKTDKGLVQTCACTSEYALIYVRKQSEAENRLYTAVEVKGRADLKIEEIIARWQQYREGQKQKLENFLASCFMELHFESTNLGPGFEISMRLKEFFSRNGRIELAQTEFYVNGVKFNNKREFPLPSIEPEKVMARPLELMLNEKYQYKLLGVEQVNGAMCYVVGIEPKTHDENLYSGKAWIDGSSFREVKLALNQRGSKSNVVTNAETQNFELVPDGKGNQFNLLKSITSQQLLNAAGRDLVLQRTLQFSEYAINTPQYEGALAAEHSSSDPMYGETDNGLRSLRKQGNERVIVEKSEKRIRSIVVGAMYAGTFNFPIPITGISIADFNYRNSGAQLSTFFAGPLLASDFSKQYGTKFRLAFDVALSALPGESRMYSGNTEQKTQDVWYWQETTGVRASWQATTGLSFTASSYFSYEYYHDTSDTDKTYTLPRDGVTLLPGLEMKYAHKGYVFTFTGTRGERLGWTQFGFASPAQPRYPGYTLYSGDFNKDFYFKKFAKVGGDLSYYGGNQLDRFSRYQPFFFSLPRIHGIPSGTDSFDAMAIGNVHGGFSVADLVKFEGMYSYARARNSDESLQFRKFDGLETNFSTAGPMGTLIQGTIGYALDGNIARYNSRWSALIMIFKPLP